MANNPSPTLLRCERCRELLAHWQFAEDSKTCIDCVRAIGQARVRHPHTGPRVSPEAVADLERITASWSRRHYHGAHHHGMD